MESHDLGSIKISGSGTASGGVYEEISISGSGKVTGDVEAKRISISGSAHFDGCVKAGVLSGSGSFEIAHDVEATECKCSGSCRIKGNVKADVLRVSGSTDIHGSAKVREADISGSATIDGDIEGECVRASGRVTIGGLLSADKVDISLHGHSKAREIGGETITVRSRQGSEGGWFGFSWNGGGGSLEVESVEGDDICLEATTAKTVRGQRVKVGPGGRIARVEYGESLEMDEDAEVGETAFTGEGTPPAVAIVRSERRPHSRSKWHMRIGDHDIHNPALKALVVLLTVPVVIGVVALVLLFVAAVIGVTLGGVGLLLVALAVGIPVIVLVAIVLRALSIPIRGLSDRWRR
jgi:cytoskeletal protein CcmA (bactofilin family)